MTGVELLVGLQAIYRLKARHDHAVDQKDAETSPGAGIVAADVSGDNPLLGVE